MFIEPDTIECRLWQSTAHPGAVELMPLIRAIKNVCKFSARSVLLTTDFKHHSLQRVEPMRYRCNMESRHKD